MSETDQTVERPELTEEGQQWIIVFVDMNAGRGSEAIGPFDDRVRAGVYADVINTHGSVQPSVTLLRGEEPQLQAPDAEVLVEVDARQDALERLGKIAPDAQPRIYGHQSGYSVFFRSSDQIVEYAVTEEGEHMRLPKSGPSKAARGFKLVELPAPARAKILELAEGFDAEHAVASPEL